MKSLKLVGVSAIAMLTLISIYPYVSSTEMTTSNQNAVSMSDTFNNRSEFTEEAKRSQLDNIEIVSAGEVDMVLYESLEQLEQAADLIIEATIIGKPETEHYEAGGVVVESYGVAKVQIKEVYKGDAAVGDELLIAEPGYFDEKGNYISFAGYKVMEEDGVYMLFLRTGKSDKRIVLGLYQGKYDLMITDEEEELDAQSLTKAEFAQKDYVGESTWRFNRLKGQVLEKYGE